MKRPMRNLLFGLGLSLLSCATPQAPPGPPPTAAVAAEGAAPAAAPVVAAAPVAAAAPAAVPAPAPAQPSEAVASAGSAPVVPSPDARGRSAAVDRADPLYARVEGTAFKNACRRDAECFKSGCSGEICSAEQANSTCEVRPWPQRGAVCGCVSGTCIWYRGKGAATSPQAPAPRGNAQGTPGQGMPCPEGRCAKGLSCLKYYGFAGMRGPAFTSCEIPCAGQGQCPAGQSCITIADGPGMVCRGKEQPPAGQGQYDVQ